MKRSSRKLPSVFHSGCNLQKRDLSSGMSRSGSLDSLICTVKKDGVNDYKDTAQRTRSLTQDDYFHLANPILREERKLRQHIHIPKSQILLEQKGQSTDFFSISEQVIHTLIEIQRIPPFHRRNVPEPCTDLSSNSRSDPNEKQDRKKIGGLQ